MRNNDRITVKIKTLNSTTFPIEVFKDNTIQEFKVAIFHKVRIHSMNQRLIYQGKVLKDTTTLRENKIEDGDVIHLVETNNSNYQNPPNQNENNRNNNNNNNNEYNRLMSSLFPNFGEFLENRNNNNNNNSNNNRNNNINTDGIYDSFKHFLINNKYNFTQSAEVLTQNINNLFNMIDNSPEITLKNCDKLTYLIDDKCQQFKIGQWIDIKDANDNWIEGQILSIQDNKVNVHYLGLSRNMNEWINIKSDRLAIFRTYTSQDITSKYLSCYPNKKEEFNDNSNNNISSIYYTSTKKFDPINNELIMFIDVLKDKIIKIMNTNAKFKINNFNDRDEYFNHERYENLLKMQLYPLFDRFGRVLIDIGNYLMFQTFKFFEDNISLFRKNIQNESLRFMNVYDTPEVVSRNRLMHFQKLIKFSVLKNKSNNDNERNNNDNNNSNNNNYNNGMPRFGILVNYRSFQRTREEERRNQMERARRYIINRENFEIISKVKNNNNDYKNNYYERNINVEDKNIQTICNEYRTLLIDKNVNSFIIRNTNNNIIKNRLSNSNIINTTKPIIKEKISINVRDKDNKGPSRTNSITRNTVKKNSLSSTKTNKFKLSTTKGKINNKK